MTEHFTDERIEAMYNDGWNSEGREELIDTYDITPEEADAICAKLAELEEADRPTIRDELIESGENLGWCKPIQVGGLIFAQNEGQIVSVKWGDEEGGTEPEISSVMLRAAKQLLGEDAVQAEISDGMKPSEMSSALAQALAWSDELCGSYCEMGCCDCPWFHECDAMRDE